MIDLDNSIRLHQAADYEDDPEIKYIWRWKAWWLVAIIGGCGICGCLYMAVRAMQ